MVALAPVRPSPCTYGMESLLQKGWLISVWRKLPDDHPNTMEFVVQATRLTDQAEALGFGNSVEEAVRNVVRCLWFNGLIEGAE